MELIFKIAWRNILRHKGKSLVIGVILFLGAYLMTIGNGVIAGMDKGIGENIINSFMGHMVILADKERSDNVLFKIYGKSVAPIYNFVQIKKVLQDDPDIKYFLPVGKNAALILNEESDMGRAFLLGVDFKAYRQMFPDSFDIIEGRFPKENEHGVLIPAFARKECYDFMNIWLLPEGGKVIDSNLTPEAKENKKDLILKDQEVFMGARDDNATADVRVGIKGIIKYKALNAFWGHFMILDIESYREALGYFSAYEKGESVPRESQALLNLDNSNLENMFGESAVVVADKKREEIKSFKPAVRVNAAPLNLDAGAYNLVFIKLWNGANLDKKAALLNKKLKEKNLDVRVVTWKKGSGVIGSLAVIIKGILFGFVVFLFLVAVIIIVNTLSMAALERVPEIGMMRAVGAQKSFVRNMFVAETAVLAGIFGGLGIILGAVTVFVLPAFHITTQNDMLQLLYGGDVLNPILNAGDIFLAIGQLALVTVASVIYPVHIAKNITPLDAVVRD